MDLKRIQRSPKAFRDQILIDVGGDTRPLRDVIEEWQQKDFAELDRTLMTIAGWDTEPSYLRSWHERCRGHSKTLDLAINSTWLLYRLQQST